MPRLYSLLAVGLVLAAAGFTSVGSRAAGAASPVIGWVEIKSVPDRDEITIIGHAYALETIAGTFSLSIVRAGEGGSSKSGQSGQFKLEAGENRALSRTSINVGPSDTLTIELKLMVDGADVFTVRMEPAAAGGGRKI